MFILLTNDGVVAYSCSGFNLQGPGGRPGFGRGGGFSAEPTSSNLP